MCYRFAPLSYQWDRPIMPDFKWSTASKIFTPAKLQAGVGDAYRRFRPREALIAPWTVVGVTDPRRSAPNGTARSCLTSNG
jgi:hypothetical protein